MLVICLNDLLPWLSYSKNDDAKSIFLVRRYEHEQFCYIIIKL